eukprot:5009067-Prymnesium_polylepis.1
MGGRGRCSACEGVGVHRGLFVVAAGWYMSLVSSPKGVSIWEEHSSTVKKTRFAINESGMHKKSTCADAAHRGRCARWRGGGVVEGGVVEGCVGATMATRLSREAVRPHVADRGVGEDDEQEEGDEPRELRVGERQDGHVEVLDLLAHARHLLDLVLDREVVIGRRDVLLPPQLRHLVTQPKEDGLRPIACRVPVGLAVDAEAHLLFGQLVDLLLSDQPQLLLHVELFLRADGTRDGDAGEDHQPADIFERLCGEVVLHHVAAQHRRDKVCRRVQVSETACA